MASRSCSCPAATHQTAWNGQPARATCGPTTAHSSPADCRAERATSSRISSHPLASSPSSEPNSPSASSIDPWRMPLARFGMP